MVAGFLVSGCFEYNIDCAPADHRLNDLGNGDGLPTCVHHARVGFSRKVGTMKNVITLVQGALRLESLAQQFNELASPVADSRVASDLDLLWDAIPSRQTLIGFRWTFYRSLVGQAGKLVITLHRQFAIEAPGLNELVAAYDGEDWRWMARREDNFFALLAGGPRIELRDDAGNSTEYQKLDTSWPVQYQPAALISSPGVSELLGPDHNPPDSEQCRQFGSFCGHLAEQIMKGQPSTARDRGSNLEAANDFSEWADSRVSGGASLTDTLLTDGGVVWGTTKSDANQQAKSGVDKPTVNHSPDFRSVSWLGTLHTFTPTQAACVKLLWEQWEGGTPEIGAATILEHVDSEQPRLSQVFRTKNVSHLAWGTMIAPGKTKGSYRLALPDTNQSNRPAP